MLAWLSVWSEVQTCIWSSWCHCHSQSLASVKSRLVLPFCYRLTWVVPEKGPLNCVCVFARAERCCRADCSRRSSDRIRRRAEQSRYSSQLLAVFGVGISRHECPYRLLWLRQGWLSVQLRLLLWLVHSPLLCTIALHCVSSHLLFFKNSCQTQLCVQSSYTCRYNRILCWQMYLHISLPSIYKAKLIWLTSTPSCLCFIKAAFH